MGRPVPSLFAFPSLHCGYFCGISFFSIRENFPHVDIQFLPYIKRFLPLNTEKWREINNFWEVFALPGQKSRSFEVFSLTFTDFLSRQSKKSPPLIAFHRSPFILQPFSGCFFLAPIILHVPIKVQVFLFPVLYLKHKEGQRTRKKQDRKSVV